MTNNNQTQNDTDQSAASDEFNNIKSVESIYPAESIEIIDCVSTSIIRAAYDLPKSDATVANDEYSAGEIYSLDNARLSKQSKSQERRANKSRLTDRRANARITASGDVQEDRRAINNIANMDAIRLAHAAKH